MNSKQKGILYLVATPIGNLEDLTFRALNTLKEVDAVACEDTRETLKLLNHYHIKKRLISYYHPKEKQKIPLILTLLKEGKNIALVSDAGTPGISDPGYPLIQETLKHKITIVPIPGPSAVTAALPASGLPNHRFLFLGFPPVKKTASRKLLLSLKDEPSTLVFYIPTRKIPVFLELINESLGPRSIVIAREMTKIYEQFIRGTSKEILEKINSLTLKGETTLLIEGSK
ncbi:MAG: 16S rRNA (cytidine(1402)-2'-O)-methyltransferase [Candidatus Aminicenantes bacterium]|nr:16S rRNA (cytidine(1402)-2'-O)-methyltransferase [Candidatus Aminicenantes bacterium]HHF52622.1 16S rRNA (cytidine(1402)-2'-O)-methyltransferase [Candidatus Aminicenantes bacterium]